ncbi:hypothetical protein FBUS_09189, partial [Fasciolopsis buskii]
FPLFVSFALFSEGIIFDDQYSFLKSEIDRKLANLNARLMHAVYISLPAKHQTNITKIHYEVTKFSYRAATLVPLVNQTNELFDSQETTIQFSVQHYRLYSRSEWNLDIPVPYLHTVMKQWGQLVNWSATVPTSVCTILFSPGGIYLEEIETVCHG